MVSIVMMYTVIPCYHYADSHSEVLSIMYMAAIFIIIIMYISTIIIMNLTIDIIMYMAKMDIMHTAIITVSLCTWVL